MISDVIDGADDTQRFDHARRDRERPSRRWEAALRACAKAGEVPAFMRMIPPMRKDQVAPRFQVGQRVRARNINPVTHTRLPRYVRGKAGTIEHDRGVAALPDTNVYGRGEN